MFDNEVETLDVVGVLEFAAGVRRVAEQAETAILTAAARYADLHSHLDEPTGRSLPGTERLVPLGGAGTPAVAEFAPAELGAELAISAFAGAQLIADALDLRHRLPRLWARLRAGEVKPWIGRRTAQATRAVGTDAAALVDARVAPWAHGLTWGRLEAIIDAAIIAADPAAAADAAEGAATRKGVWVGRSTDHGIKDIYIRADAPDVIWFDATLGRIAEGLRLLGSTDSTDVRRAAAVGVIAHPQRCLDMFDQAAAFAGPDTGPDVPPPGDPDDPATSGLSGNSDDFCYSGGQADLDDPNYRRDHRVSLNGANETTTAPHGRGRRVDSRPPAVLYVHLTDQALAGDGSGTVVRFEGVGPVTVEQARRFLAHCHVTVKPVLDLAAMAPVDAYEIPDRLREATHLRSPADVFPYATNLGRTKDLDHTIPYRHRDHGGPPSQTRLDNLGPMTRLHHRVKTHGRWRVDQPTNGVFIWTTPHGRRYQVDHTGTHPVAASDMRERCVDAEAADPPAA